METRSSPSMSDLRLIARDRGLKYYMHLSKLQLYELLQRKEGGATTTPMTVPTSDIPQQCDVSSSIGVQGNRHSERLKRKSDVEDEEREYKQGKTVINTRDPIMLTELGPHTFEFERSNGSIVAYNVDTLVQYILATGDFSEPETRLAFSNEDLKRIDAEAKRANLNERSVLAAKFKKQDFEEQKVNRDGLLGLERCAGEYITQMLDIVEDDDPEEGEVELIMNLFPAFSSIFDQIRANDKEYAKQCMNHFNAYLRGPKNRPTEDTSGLLCVILSFLEDVENGRQDASAFGF